MRGTPVALRVAQRSFLVFPGQGLPFRENHEKESDVFGKESPVEFHLFCNIVAVELDEATGWIKARCVTGEVFLVQPRDLLTLMTWTRKIHACSSPCSRSSISRPRSPLVRAVRCAWSEHYQQILSAHKSRHRVKEGDHSLCPSSRCHRPFLACCVLPPP